MLRKMSAPTKAPPPAVAGPVQISAVIAGVGLVLFVAFYFLSGFYFEDKRKSASMMGAVITDGMISDVRLAFAILIASVVAASVAVVFQAKWVAHGIAGIAGVASLIAAYFAYDREMPGVLTSSLFILGFMFPLLAWRSLERSRAAWSFLLSLCFVLGTVMLFGAPKLKSTIGHGMSLWHAMILPCVLIVAGVAFSVLRADYREKAIVSRST